MNTLSVMRVLAAVATVGFASGLGSVVAQEATPGPTAAVLPPDAEVAGLGLAEWSARSWQWFFSLPPDVNPVADDTGARCGYGQAGPVFFLAGAERSVERSCVVPLGAHVFVPLLGSECSTDEPPPFFGRDETDLRRYAADAVDMAERSLDMSAMSLEVDGQAVDDLAAYRAATPLLTLWLPEDNLLGTSSRAADSVADGYQVMLAPMSEGEHVVLIGLPGPQSGDVVTIAYRLTVVSGAAGDAAP